MGKEELTNLRCNVTFWNTNERFVIAGQLNCKIQIRHKTLIKGVTAISNAKLKYIPTNYKSSKKHCITKRKYFSSNQDERLEYCDQTNKDFKITVM